MSWVDSGFPSCGVLVCIKVNCYDWTLDNHLRMSFFCSTFPNSSSTTWRKHSNHNKGAMNKCIVWRVAFFIPRYPAVRNHLKEGYLLSWNRRDDSWCYTSVVNSSGHSIELLSKYTGRGWNLRVFFVRCLIKPKKMGCYKWRHFPKRSQWQPILFHKTEQIPYSEKAMAAAVHGYPSRPLNKTPRRNLTLILGWNVEVGKFFLGGISAFSLG